MENSDIENLISRRLLGMGVSPNLKGYRYLKESILMVVNDNSLIENFNRRLYPIIAEKYGDTAYAIERSMRHVLNVLRGRSCNDEKSKIDLYAFETRDLTVKQFIAVLVEDVYLQLLYKK